MQVPVWHVSVCVHALPSLHAAPLAFGGLLQVPVPTLHVPTSWHWSIALQTTALPPVHAPAWHVSVTVHELPSEHAAPLAFAGLLHVPVAPSQVPALWHWSTALHTTGLAPVHVPV